MTIKESSFTRDKLTAFSINILKQNFPEEIKKSHQVKGILSLKEFTDAGTLFELVSIFLYRETYTAVSHRIVFTLKDEKVTIISSE